MMTQTVSLLVEIPEDLHVSIQTYLDSHPNWSHERLFCASLSLFLMQNGASTQTVSRIYLDSLFGQPKAA
jgi:hypothetical protein